MSCANIIARMPEPHILLRVTAPAESGRRRLALAGHQAVADQSFVDGVAGHAGALDGRLDGDGAELPRGQRGEVAQHAADGRAGGGNDDDGIGHGVLLGSGGK
jgi:hypothetical protein